MCPENSFLGELGGHREGVEGGYTIFSSFKEPTSSCLLPANGLAEALRVSSEEPCV